LKKKIFEDKNLDNNFFWYIKNKQLEIKKKIIEDSINNKKNETKNKILFQKKIIAEKILNLRNKKKKENEVLKIRINEIKKSFALKLKKRK
jgi:hypothetical protein